MKNLRCLALAAMALPVAASAAVIDTLPWNAGSTATVADARNNSPEWTVVVFPNTSMSRDAASDPGPMTMTTSSVRGVWFGNYVGAGVNDNNPTWSLGSPEAGNLLTLQASFSSGAADWSMDIYDGSHHAAFRFNPTDCSNSCYDDPVVGPLSYVIAQPGGLATQRQTVHYAGTPGAPLDMTQQHSFEILLKDGRVSYRIDGQLLYVGDAVADNRIDQIVIGDGSGSTQTGKGSMTVHAVSVDNAPSVSVVPEPGSALLWLAGLAGLAAAAPRRRASRG